MFRYFSIALALTLSVPTHATAELRKTDIQVADGSTVTITVDTATGKPIAAESPLAVVRAASLSLWPTNATVAKIAYKWAFAVELKTDVQPSKVTVEDVSGNKVRLEVDDSTPSIKNRIWQATTREVLLVDDRLTDFRSQDFWIVIFKISITLPDNSVSYLYQPAAYGPNSRDQMYKLALQAIGKPLSDQKADRRIDSRQWKVGYETSNSSQQLTEFVLPGQTVETWQELFTRQLFADSERKISMDKLTARIKEGFSADCKNLQWSIFRQEAAEVIYQWSHDGCNARQPQFEVARLIRTNRGVCRWAYTSKLVPVPTETQREFRSIVEKLECD